MNVTFIHILQTNGPHIFLRFTNAKIFRELVLRLENTQSNDPCTNITFLVIALKEEEKEKDHCSTGNLESEKFEKFSKFIVVF